METDAIPVEYGNRQGQYFTEWRFDLLKELLGRIHEGPMPPQSEIVEIENAQIWYDAREDFHRLSFRARGRLVEVQLYKVFSSKIDGEEHWVGCPRNQIWEYALSIRRKLGVVPKG
jgi:hypothetical protein